MTEKEYRNIREIRLKIGQLGAKYGMQQDNKFKDVLANIRDLMDDYLYEDYVKFLSNNEYVDKVSESDKNDFIDHCKNFIKEYKERHKNVS